MADRYAYIPLVGLFVMVVWPAGGLGGGAPNLGATACDSGGWLFASAWSPHLPAGGLLARHGVVLAQGAGADGQQLHCA